MGGREQRATRIVLSDALTLNNHAAAESFQLTLAAPVPRTLAAAVDRWAARLKVRARREGAKEGAVSSVCNVGPRLPFYVKS